MNTYLDARREQAKKRVAGLAKVGPPIEYRVGETLVTLTKQPMEYDYPAKDANDTPCGQKFKAKYRVEVDGVHRGWLVAKAGWGSDWYLHRLRHSGEVSYWSTDQIAMRIAPTAQNPLNGEQVREKIAKAIPELVRTGQLGTLAEQDEQKRQREIKRKQQEREDEEKREGWRRERVAENRKLLAALIDRENTLRGMLDRQVLTNYESEIIGQLIAENAKAIAARKERIGADGEQL